MNPPFCVKTPKAAEKPQNPLENPKAAKKTLKTPAPKTSKPLRKP